MEDTQRILPFNSDPGTAAGGGSSSFDNAPWSSESTWIIASGSLENSITFDSSEDDDYPGESVSPREYNPLILKPPSSDSAGPCEIKLYFAHKYNIRQIYIRSTARTFEIYHSQSQNGEKEYLCTARCSVAERDNWVLQSKFEKETVKDTASGQNKFDEEETIASSEDDWVDVKVLDSPPPVGGTQSELNKIDCCLEGVVQDYYEATVEINDSEPCSLVTIRFLSLQSKDYVFIDEIYVFGELVGPIQSGTQAPDITGSAGNPLMAMLFPAILQLSKSRANKFQAEEASLNKVGILSNATVLTEAIPPDESVPVQQYLKLQDHETLENVNKVEIISEVTETPQDEKSDADHQYAKFQDLEENTESANSQIHDQNLAGDKARNPLVTCNSPCHCIDEVLEQLVSRVSKIEEVCLRFEENMLKPMSRMEMRLQRVEEQLESLAKNSDHSGVPNGTRFSAPSFSCNSNSSSIHNDGSDGHPSSRSLALNKGDKEEFSSCSLLNTFEGMPDSVKPPRLLPSLVVSAPEFSFIEDDQDDACIEPSKENNKDADGIEALGGTNQEADVSKSFEDSPEIKPRQCSIDDVLAAALSNFLLSSSDNPSERKQRYTSDYVASQIVGNEMCSQNAKTLNCSTSEVTTTTSAREEPPKYTQILTVTAPEFSLEEIGGEEDSDFVQLPSEEDSAPPFRADGSDEVPLSFFQDGLVQVTSESPHCVENELVFDQHVVANDEAPVILSSVTSESSHCVENKSAYDQVVVTNDETPLILSPVTSKSSQCVENKVVFDQVVVTNYQAPLIFSTVTSESSHCVGNKSALDQLVVTNDPIPLISSTVTSESSHFVENKSEFDQLVLTNDPIPLISSPVKNFSLETVQNQFFEDNTFRYLFDGSSSSTMYQAEDSESLGKADKEADQIESPTIHLSPENKDVVQNLFESEAVTEGKQVWDKLFESPVVTRDSFSSTLGDITFTPENSSIQPSIETLLGHHQRPPQLHLAENSPKESVGIDFSADEYKFIELEDNDFIDPQTGERLLVELGISDSDVSNFEDESSEDVNNCTNSSIQKTLASLI